MKKVLVLYSSIDGHTQYICEYIVKQLKNKKSIEVDYYPLNEFVARQEDEDNTEEDILNYDLLILGASIRYGKHRPYVSDFINTHQADLRKIPTAFFSVNLVARKPEKNTPETNVYMRKFLEQIAWKPNVVDVFAGKLDYSRYGLLDKLVIKFIMWLTKGETSSNEPIIYTDWDRVETFAEKIITFLDSDHIVKPTTIMDTLEDLSQYQEDESYWEKLPIQGEEELANTSKHNSKRLKQKLSQLDLSKLTILASDTDNSQEKSDDKLVENINNTQEKIDDKLTENIDNSQDKSDDKLTENIDNSQEKSDDKLVENIDNSQDKIDDKLTENTDNAQEKIDDKLTENTDSQQKSDNAQKQNKKSDKKKPHKAKHKNKGKNKNKGKKKKSKGK